MASTQPLKIGIIGAGIMGRAHAGFLAREEQTELAAVADPYTTALAEDAGVPHFTDHRQLLRMEKLDAVIVANPNAFHVSTAVDCLDAGVPVLLEKPAAASYAEAADLVAAAGRSSTPLLVGHHRRHHPAVRAARRLIGDGGLGRIVAVNGMWLTKKADSYFDQVWRREPGAGVMLINLVHDLDLIRHLCGEIVSIQARTSNSVRGFDVEDTAGVVFETESGALGSFIASDAATAPWGWDQATEDDPTYPYNPTSFCYSIAGTEASLSFPQLGRYYHEGPSDWTRPLSLRFEAKEAGDSYTNQLRHFAAVIRREAAPAVTAADAARTLAVVEAAARAAAEGCTVRVADVLGG
ncbi:Gfo/Idh/MocA family oxidoreductase [Paenarthrobacter sp. DKR-5]|uniref:Gfo/Idh/MocA family protein n=1 Tax=Paenarthrobacter sp. DKR-5 TaxID=2835535 RepID=UPI001BDCF24C|nr:Gfo/Idh/MocA family oxidoreductase [Paenarthrobacter sp. DKR-5]MBT1003099.1 Gfo/Idh/MocA family oxidoreductase [Paenarthrobacter sp. DKR-5]